MKPRLLALAIHPAPYRDPVFCEILKRGNIHIDFRFYFPFDDGHTEWDWSLISLQSKTLTSGLPFPKEDRLHLSIAYELMHEKYDAVLIPGYSRATSAAAIILSEILRIPFILSVDSLRHVAETANTWRSVIRRHLLKRAAAIWVPGVASRKYLISQNVKSEKIFEGAYCFDSKYLLSLLEDTKTRRAETRRSIGISDDSFVFLTVGNMIKTRRYVKLVETFIEASEGLSTNLLMIGNGPERATIEALIQSSDKKHIQLLGSVSFRDLFTFYSAADAFVHPGVEPFSTATELAAIAGLPIIATPGVGYVHDLINRGVQPLLSDIDDVDGLKSNLKALIVNRRFARELGAHTELVATQRNAQWAAEELEKAVFFAVRAAS